MIERAEGRLRWEGGTTIVMGCEKENVVLSDLFGSAHPAAKEIVLDDDRLSEWTACVKRLPLKSGELPPALIVEVDASSQRSASSMELSDAKDRLKKIHHRLIEPTPLVLVTRATSLLTADEESNLTHAVDIVIQCTPQSTGHRPSKRAWRFIKSRFQATREDSLSELSPAMMGVARFYYDRATASGGEDIGVPDWQTFLAGWKASMAWQASAGRKE